MVASKAVETNAPTKTGKGNAIPVSKAPGVPALRYQSRGANAGASVWALSIYIYIYKGLFPQRTQMGKYLSLSSRESHPKLQQRRLEFRLLGPPAELQGSKARRKRTGKEILPLWVHQLSSHPLSWITTTKSRLVGRKYHPHHVCARLSQTSDIYTV